MREFNGRQKRLKYKTSRVIRELSKAWPEKMGQIMREFLEV